VVADGTRDADATRRCQSLQPHRDVDGVAVNVAAVDDQVAEVDTNAKPQAARLGKLQITVDHRALDFGSAAHRVDDTGEFRQHTVTGGLDDAAVMLAGLRVDDFAHMRLEALVRAFLVRSHQARIADHIGREDCGETAGRGHSLWQAPFPKIKL